MPCYSAIIQIFIFHGTLLDNIAFGIFGQVLQIKEAPPGRVWAKYSEAFYPLLSKSRLRRDQAPKLRRVASLLLIFLGNWTFLPLYTFTIRVYIGTNPTEYRKQSPKQWFCQNSYKSWFTYWQKVHTPSKQKTTQYYTKMSKYSSFLFDHFNTSFHNELSAIFLNIFLGGQAISNNVLRVC